MEQELTACAFLGFGVCGVDGVWCAYFFFVMGLVCVGGGREGVFGTGVLCMTSDAAVCIVRMLEIYTHVWVAASEAG